MNLAVRAIKKVLPHFNERAVTKEDLFRIFRERGIHYHEMPLNNEGYYALSDDGDEYVITKYGLRDPRLSEALLHEFVHAIVHYPNPNCPKQHAEAIAISLMAMIPLSSLNYWLSIAGSLEDEDYDLVRRRFEVYKKYNQ